MGIVIAILIAMLIVESYIIGLLIKKTRAPKDTPEATQVDMSAYFSSLSQEQWKDFTDDPAKVSSAFQQFKLASIAAERAITLSQDHHEAARELTQTAKRKARNGKPDAAEKALKASTKASANADAILFSRHTEVPQIK